MKTLTGDNILEEVRGILYICEYNYEDSTIKIVRVMGFASAFDALNAYANIPNPESQMASGGTKEEFEKDLKKLHARMNDPEWVKELAGYL